MKSDVKNLWVSALRSGEFEQGIGQLKIEGPDGKMHYCCLGVLTELYHRETGKGVWSNREAVLRFVDDHENTSYGFLTADVCKWAGLDTSPIMGGEFLHRMNDSGTSFTKIAEVIEQNS